MSTPASHIVILCSRLDLPGGIERTISNLSRLFFEKRNRVSVMILDSTANSFYPFPQGVTLKQFDLTFGIGESGNMLTRKLELYNNIRSLKKILTSENADLVICTEYQFAIAAVLSGIQKKTKVISWEHHHYYWIKRNKFWEYLHKKIYPKLNTVVCLNKDEAILYSKAGCTVKAIPNFIFPVTSHTKNNREILSIGNLIHRKGIDLLLTAAKIVLEKYPHWQWKIIGDGEMEKTICHFIKNNNLHGKLILETPVTSNTEQLYNNSSLFALTSRMEPFGMVLAEAMSFGIPCVSFDCETGPRHIITNNEDGILVEKENPEKLAAAISTLIENEELRKKMGEKAVLNVQRFSPEIIYKLWEQVF